MSAILYPTSQWLDSQRGANTGASAPPLPAGVDVVGSASRFVHGGVSKLESWMGGGIHPETATAPPPLTVLSNPTDSVAGRFGGLIPRPTSTVAPGPAGSSAVQRSNLFGSLKRAVTPSTPPGA